MTFLQFRHDESNFCSHFCRDWSSLKRRRRVETHFCKAKYFIGRVVKLLSSIVRWRESGSWPGTKPLSWRRASPHHATPLLEIAKSILHQMPVIFPGFPAVASGRYHHRHSQLSGLGHDVVGIIPPVRQQMFRRDVRKQRQGRSAIGYRPRRQQHPYRQARRVHGQVRFAVPPPLVRAKAWLPPRPRPRGDAP